MKKGYLLLITRLLYTGISYEKGIRIDLKATSRRFPIPIIVSPSYLSGGYVWLRFIFTTRCTQIIKTF